MNTLNTIETFLNECGNLPEATFKETPLYAVQLLVYIGQHDNRPIYAEELIQRFRLKPDKVYRALRNYLNCYVIGTDNSKEGVKGPVKTWRLSQKGRDYVARLYETLK